MRNPKVEFGRILSEKMKEMGLKNVSVAKMLNVNRSTITRWKTGVMFPQFWFLEDISRKLKIPYDDLIQLYEEVQEEMRKRKERGEKREKKIRANEVPQLLKEARENLGLSLREVAEMIGVNKTVFWNWEKGVFLPGLDKLKKISEVLEIPYERLLKAYIRDKEKQER